jgi:3-oxoacyl-[acyl-carrier protein] reductase
VGRATALLLAAAGADVVVCHRTDTGAAERLHAELAALGRRHDVLRADLRNQEDADRVAERCRQLLGGLDVVVNNVGIFAHDPISSLTREAWREILDTNLTAAYHVLHAVLGLLSPGAAIVNVGASAAWRGISGAAHFTASKAAIAGLTASLVKELGPRGVRVNLVEPGIVDDPADATMPAGRREGMAAVAALRRLPTPEDVAAAVVFLAADQARSVTGATLAVDGGM